jgi:alcohol dehydrogenase
LRHDVQVISRAAVLTQLGLPRPFAGAVQVRELELAEPGHGELLVRVEAAGLCHSDLSVVDGSRPRPVPMVLGHEAAGVVVGTGPGVHDVQVGDHVVLVFVPSCGSCPECAGGRPALCRRGAASNAAGELLRGGRRWSEGVAHHLGVSAFAEHVVVDRVSAVVIDDDVPFEVAALFGCALLTGVGAVQRTAGVRPGQSVGIWGLGGVGMAAVIGAALAGAHPILAVDPVLAKRELARALGATHTAAPGEELPFLVDVAVEAVGSAPVLRSAFDATARGGRTVSVGLPAPDALLSIPAVTLVAEARTLQGSYLGDAAPQRDIPAMVGLWRAGRLPVQRLVDGHCGLDGLGQALEDLASGSVLRRIIHPQQG